MDSDNGQWYAEKRLVDPTEEESLDFAVLRYSSHFAHGDLRFVLFVVLDVYELAITVEEYAKGVGVSKAEEMGICIHTPNLL